MCFCTPCSHLELGHYVSPRYLAVSCSVFVAWASEIYFRVERHARVDSGYMFRSVNEGVWNIHMSFYVPVDLGSCMSSSPSS